MTSCINYGSRMLDFAALLLLLFVYACVDGQITPPHDLQQDLFAAESVFTGVTVSAVAYSDLPYCTGVNLGGVKQKGPCVDPDVEQKIYNAMVDTRIVFTKAEVAILGCPVAVYVASKDTPPSEACGIPLSDQTAQQKALTEAQAALSVAQALIPKVTP